MRLLISLLLPWLTFFTIGRPVAGIICLILQITLIGWIPATIWAVFALSEFKTDQKIKKATQSGLLVPSRAIPGATESTVQTSPAASAEPRNS